MVSPPQVGLFFRTGVAMLLKKQTWDFMASAFFLSCAVNIHKHFHNFYAICTDQTGPGGGRDLLHDNEQRLSNDGEGWGGKKGVRGTFVGARGIKSLDEDSVCVFVCICVAGGWVSLL